MKAALFVDRDGIVNQEQGYILRVEDFVFEPAFWTIARLATEADMPIVVITNQGGIGKGLMTEADLVPIHQRLREGFAAHQLPQPHIYYCPHHPESGNCLCRKPSRLWFERALARHRLRAAGSWMLGDRNRDLIPARELGLQTVMIGDLEHPGLRSPHADHQFADLEAAAAWFLAQGWHHPLPLHSSSPEAHVRPS